MSLKEELDSLRKAHAGVDDLVYADFAAKMVLYASSGGARAQEIYDGLVQRAGDLLAADGPTAGMAGEIGADPADALVLDGDGAGLRLIVRTAANPEECLIFDCRADVDVAAVSQAAAETLTRFAASGQ